ncbi:Sensor histidine kinase YpdA [compost metagenome]
MKIRRLRWHGSKNLLRNKLIAIVSIMVIPLVSMLIYNNFYAIGVVRGQVSDSYSNSLHLYMNQLDTALNDADSYMTMITSAIAGSNELLALSQADTDDDYYLAKIYLSNILMDDMGLYRIVDTFFVYETEREDYMEISKSGMMTFEQKEALQKFLVDSITGGILTPSVNSRTWKQLQVGGKSYFAFLVQAESAYLGALVSADQLIIPLKGLDLGDGGAILLVNDYGEPFSASELLDEHNIDLEQTHRSYHFADDERQYLMIQADSVKGDFHLVALVPDNHILANLPYLQRISWFIMIAILCCIPFGLYMLRRLFLIPLTGMLIGMKKVRGGDWSVRVDMEPYSNEFRVLGESFNLMMNELQTLRVNVFEEQLNKQREELQRLQLQVNPHFFLNALNIVYNLAKVKNYQLVIEMTMSLTHYFRYMFRSVDSFVKIRDELEHTRNYLRIQVLRFPGQLTWKIEAPPYVLDSPVPPLIIHSFTENSIKHAVTMDYPIHFRISVDWIETEEQTGLLIKIEDTGKGFDPEILRDLKLGNNISNKEGEHTGIWNAQRRVKLLYGESASISFDNHPDTGGAVIELCLLTKSE